MGTEPSIDDNLSAGVLEYNWPGAAVAATKDGGSTWVTSLSDANGLWGLDVLNATDVWAVGVESLYATTDGGVNWTKVGEPSGTALVNVQFSGPSTGLGITTQGGLLITSDGGRTWTGPPSPSLASGLADACTDSTGFEIVDQRGDIWNVGSLSTSPEVTEVFSSSAEADTMAVVSCNADGQAWEEVYPN
jgi:photosystem II stability/assembly factor-like uncharacterized protein